MENKVITVKLQMTELERSFYNQQIKAADPSSQTSNTAFLKRIADALDDPQSTNDVVGLLNDIKTAITAQNDKLDAIATAISQLDLSCTVNNYITPEENQNA